MGNLGLGCRWSNLYGEKVYADVWLQATGAAGFRLDAIKHMDRQFLLEWVRRRPDHVTCPYSRI